MTGTSTLAALRINSPMHRISFLLVFVSFGLSLFAADQAVKPEALLTQLYQVHDAGKSPFFQNKDRALVNRYFVKELADLIWKDAQTTDGVGAIDFDPLYNAQDTEIKKLVINKAKTTEGKTTVLVTFLNFDEKQSITYHLVQQNGAWKISEIDYGEGFALLKQLRLNARN
jgi:hypothetical protein